MVRQDAIGARLAVLQSLGRLRLQVVTLIVAATPLVLTYLPVPVITQNRYKNSK